MMPDLLLGRPAGRRRSARPCRREPSWSCRRCDGSDLPERGGRICEAELPGPGVAENNEVQASTHVGQFDRAARGGRQRWQIDVPEGRLGLDVHSVVPCASDAVCDSMAAFVPVYCVHRSNPRLVYAFHDWHPNLVGNVLGEPLECGKC